MDERNVKSKHILTKLRVHDYEYRCDWIAKFHKKILFITRVINIQILMTKYFSFQYSITYCSQALRRPAHRACKTVHLLIRETPDYITPALWPANSPDLNPVDYQIWGKLQERVYHSQICDVDQLKSRQIEEWEHFHQVVIDKVVRQWRPCSTSSTQWAFGTQTLGVLSPAIRTDTHLTVNHACAYHHHHHYSACTISA